LGEQFAALLHALKAMANDICRRLVMKVTQNKGRLEENAQGLLAD
jgi:hypothetical protein